jgi:hypothetical protein
LNKRDVVATVFSTVAWATLAIGWIAFATSATAQYIVDFSGLFLVPLVIVTVLAGVTAIVGAERTTDSGRSARWRVAGIMLAVGAGAVGLALGWVVLTVLIVADVFIDFGEYELFALSAAIVSIVAGTAAVFAAGRASVRSNTAVWIVFSAGLATLPIGWGFLLVAAARCLRGAGPAQTRRIARLPGSASACAAAASTWTITLCGILLQERIVYWPSFAAASLGVASVVFMARPTLLGALFALSAGALWLEFGTGAEAALVNLAGIPFLFAGALGFVAWLRRSPARLTAPRHTATTTPATT